MAVRKDYSAPVAFAIFQRIANCNNASESFFEQGNSKTGWDLFSLGNNQYLCVAPSHGKYWAKFSTRFNKKTCIWH